jgi:serine-type D-Ala-D-Ala carboxypeptidase/endopeptidase
MRGWPVVLGCHHECRRGRSRPCLTSTRQSSLSFRPLSSAGRLPRSLSPLWPWYPERSFLRAARRSLATAPGGQPYAYSNFGAGLLGYLLGEAAQVPYQRLVEERICRPLTMSATSFDARPVQGYSNGRKVPPWHLGAMAAAGGLYSTASDMAKLLTACLRPPDTALAESAPLALATHAVLSPRAEMGLGWHHALRDGRRVSWHNA